MLPVTALYWLLIIRNGKKVKGKKIKTRSAASLRN